MIANRSVPTSTVIPVLAYPDVGEAVDWLCRAFGLRVRLRIASHRAQLLFGDGAIIVTARGAVDPGDAPGPADPGWHAVHARVEDVDGHHEQAVRNGAWIVSPPADYPYGERQYTAIDIGGHRWTFSQSIADVDPAAWGAMVFDLT